MWVLGAIVLAADQWSKETIIDWLSIGETWRPWAGSPILELFAFTHTKNSGAAFGIFPSASWFFVIVAISVAVAIVWYTPRLPRHQWWLFLSLGLELGGTLGNLTDRIRLGWVTDFVHIGSFAIFNIADSAIVCGVIILFVHFWLEDKQRLEQEKADITQWTTLEPDEWNDLNESNRGLLATNASEIDESQLRLPPNDDSQQEQTDPPISDVRLEDQQKPLNPHSTTQPYRLRPPSGPVISSQ